MSISGTFSGKAKLVKKINPASIFGKTFFLQKRSQSELEFEADHIFWKPQERLSWCDFFLYSIHLRQKQVRMKKCLRDCLKREPFTTIPKQPLIRTNYQAAFLVLRMCYDNTQNLYAIYSLLIENIMNRMKKL